MATYALGKVGLKLCGNYDASTTYNMLDVVTYGGNCYAALQTCTGVPVTNTEYWQMLCAGNAESYSTDEVCTGGTWIDGKPIYRKTVQFNSLTTEAITIWKSVHRARLIPLSSTTGLAGKPIRPLSGRFRILTE